MFGCLLLGPQALLGVLEGLLEPGPLSLHLLQLPVEALAEQGEDRVPLPVLRGQSPGGRLGLLTDGRNPTARVLHLRGDFFQDRPGVAEEALDVLPDDPFQIGGDGSRWALGPERRRGSGALPAADVVTPAAVVR